MSGLVAVQVQPVKVVTAIEPFVEPKLTAALLGEIPNVQGAPAWFTVKFCPATVTTPLRAIAVGFVSKVYPTVPLFVL